MVQQQHLQLQQLQQLQQQYLSSVLVEVAQATVLVVDFAAVGGDAGGAGEPYTTFLVSVASRRKDGALAQWTVYRRFSAFLLLLQRLERCDSLWLTARPRSRQSR